MLPMLSNDVYSLLLYGSLAARGHDVYVTAASLPDSPFYAWVGEHWASKVCVYGPTTLVSTFPAVLGPWGAAGAVFALRITWLVLLVAAMEFSFRRLEDRPLFQTMVWCNPLFMVEGPGQLHADILGMSAVVVAIGLSLGRVDRWGPGPAVSFARWGPGPTGLGRRRLVGSWALYSLAVLGKYTYVFAGPWFWLFGAVDWRQRALRLLALTGLLVSLGALLYAPFWRGTATLLEPVRALGGMNPGGSIVEIVGHIVHALRGGAVPPADLPPQVAIELERAAKGSTWAVTSFVLRVVFVGVTARQLYGMLRRRADAESLAVGTGAIVVAAISLFSHRFQSWYLIAALPWFGLRCEGAWRRWWLLAVAFSVATEFIHVLPRTAALLPVWSVVTNGGVVVVFLLWFRDRFLRLEPQTAQEPPPAAAARPATRSPAGR
jgi:hypothetical protein